MFTLTAPDLIALAVNVVQNGWTDAEAGIDPKMRKTLEEIYAQILTANRTAAERALEPHAFAAGKLSIGRWTALRFGRKSLGVDWGGGAQCSRAA